MIRTQPDDAGREARGQLLCDGADAVGGQAVGARCQAAHDKLEQPRAGAQAVVEEDAAQKRTEKAVNDRLGEAPLLPTRMRFSAACANHNVRPFTSLTKVQRRIMSNARSR